MSDVKYFNFPIQLLENFLGNSKKCLNNISDYSLYVHAKKLGHGTILERIKASANFYDVSLGDAKSTIENGRSLCYDFKDSPMVGINLTIFWDFWDNYKTDFEKVCLLGFLAFKSIVQNKAYCRVTNKYWLARMDGKAKSCETEKLSNRIVKYANEYQTRKIKNELVDSWNLKTYSHYTRGFYISFKLSEDNLAFIAEKKRKSIKDKERKENKKQAYLKAIKRLNNED